MCELMAMSFEDPLSASFSLRAFGTRGDLNADGWGLGWYPDHSLAMVKEPIKWSDSLLAGFLTTQTNLRSRTFLAHVRDKTTGGEPSHADTHPFAREQGGRDYCFGHNGTLDDRVWKLPLGHHRPVGATDSEQFFCHLLGEIASRGAALDTPPDWAWLHETLATANRLGKLNCLLSDGQRLFVYHDVNGWKGLNFLKIHVRQDQPDHWGVDSLSVDLASKRSNHGFVVATYPLNESGWHSFQLGELIVFDRGVIQYSSHRATGRAEFGRSEPALPQYNH